MFVEYGRKRYEACDFGTHRGYVVLVMVVLEPERRLVTF